MVNGHNCGHFGNRTMRTKMPPKPAGLSPVTIYADICHHVVTFCDRRRLD